MKMHIRTSGASLATALVLLAGTAFAQGTPGTKDDPVQAPRGATSSQPQDQGKMHKSDTGMEQGAAAKADHQAKDVQEALKAKGFDPGPVDGILGPKTTTALREFQRTEGLPTTGQLDEPTREKLGMM